MDSKTLNEEINNVPKITKLSKSSPFMKLSSYLLATRPWSLSASLMPVILGYSLAYKTSNESGLLRLIFSIITTLSVHGAGNLVNTYYDYQKGIDNKKSDDKTLVDQLLTEHEVTILGIVLYLIGCFGFLILAIISPIQLIYLSIVFFCGLSGSLMYTGGIGFKYIGLGDVLVIIIFGPVTVLFSYMVQTGNINWGIIIYAIPLAINAEAILHSNNTKNMESDKQAGIVTLSILIGLTASEVLFALLLLSPYTMFIIFGMKYSTSFFLPLFTIREAFSIERHFRTHSKRGVPQKTKTLNMNVGMLYILAIFLADTSKLPFIRI